MPAPCGAAVSQVSIIILFLKEKTEERKNV